VTERQTHYGQGLIVLLGLFAFASILAFHNITEGDLWAQLAIGASVWEHGHLLRHDIFAFTPTLPEWIAHEWGAGVVFYGVLKIIGPTGLMGLKIALAIGALAFGIAAGCKQGCELDILLLLAVLAAACILPGYIPVLRSHAFTYFFFGLTLFLLEEFRVGRRWAALALPLVLLLWTNLHGGFVVGLGVVFLYAAASWLARKNAALMAGVAAACAAVTLINPYGVKFWQYLIPALLHPRARITEWRPLPLLAWDDFWGFRLLFLLTVMAIALGWKQIFRKNFTGLAVLALTAFMAWRSRRHGPFFGLAALAFAGPYYAGVAAKVPAAIRARVNPTWAVGIVYAGIVFFVALKILPDVSAHPMAPVGEVPVREADILSRAGARGNMATPFAWGSYLTWRLYPNIKISMDGRYETTYPESTFDLNNAFFDHRGDWMKLCRSYKVDYVILDLAHEPLQAEDLTGQGYSLIWKLDTISALLCLPEHAAALGEAAQFFRTNVPPMTIDPLDLSTRPAALFPTASGAP
jgi:hypothetical protein